MNKIFLAGNIGKSFQEGVPAVDTKVYGDKELTTFRLSIYEGKGKDGKSMYTNLTIRCWNKPWLKERLREGSFVALEGRLDVSTYEAKDGTRKTSYCVVAETVDLPLEPRNAAPQTAPSAPATSKNVDDGFPF